jgi:hypothetical protein
VYPTFIPITGEGSAQFSYRGCFPDSHENRALGSYSITSSDMTPAICAGHCWEQSYTWAGVEYGQECWVSQGFFLPTHLSSLFIQCSNTNNAAGTAVALSNCMYHHTIPKFCLANTFYDTGAQACDGDSFYSCGAPNFIDVYQSGSPPRDTLPQ